MVRHLERPQQNDRVAPRKINSKFGRRNVELKYFDLHSALRIPRSPSSSSWPSSSWPAAKKDSEPSSRSRSIRSGRRPLSLLRKRTLQNARWRKQLEPDRRRARHLSDPLDHNQPGGPLHPLCRHLLERGLSKRRRRTELDADQRRDARLHLGRPCRRNRSDRSEPRCELGRGAVHARSLLSIPSRRFNRSSEIDPFSPGYFLSGTGVL